MAKQQEYGASQIEVLEGLKDGARIVTGGQIRLKDGVKVTVNE